MIDKKAIRKARARGQKRATEKLVAAVNSATCADNNSELLILLAPVRLHTLECHCVGAVVGEELAKRILDLEKALAPKQERKAKAKKLSPKPPKARRMDSAESIKDAIVNNSIKGRRERR